MPEGGLFETLWRLETPVPNMGLIYRDTDVGIVEASWVDDNLGLAP